MGVLGVIPGQIGLVQATEVLKLILKVGNPLIGKFFIYGALTSYFDVMDVGKNPNCPLCGEQPSIKGITGGDNGDVCAI